MTPFAILDFSRFLYSIYYHLHIRIPLFFSSVAISLRLNQEMSLDYVSIKVLPTTLAVQKSSAGKNLSTVKPSDQLLP
jgi:hypothetical protein